MKTIKFKTKVYELADDPNVMPSHFQASIVGGDNSIDEIIDEATDISSITLFEDGETIAIYYEFKTLFVVSYSKDNDIISVEMLNTDLEAQINALSANVTNLQESQEALMSSKMDAEVVGYVEYIDKSSKHTYEPGDTFAINGQMYKAIVKIWTGDAFIIGGNCELTNLTEEINSFKESEVLE